jgi:hypothetical protein
MTRRLVVMCAVGVLAACGSSNPKTKDVLQRVGTSYCSMLDRCFAGGFDLAFPGGEAQCVGAMLNASSVDPDAEDACSSSEVDACVHDIDAMGCPAFVPATLASLPSSCAKC